MAPMVRQWLSVNRSTPGMHIPGVDTVWTRDVAMDFLPAKGDMIMLWVDPDQTDRTAVAIGKPWPVWERCFFPDGHAEIELVDILVDPDERSLATVRALRDASGAPWWTETDGTDVEGLLRSGGWKDALGRGRGPR